MDENLFQIVQLGLRIALIAIFVYVAPAVNDWFLANASPKQREDLTYWTKIAVIFYENHFKGKGSGLGPLKKENVIKWLNEKKIKFTEKQLGALIDLIVFEFNTRGWPQSVDELIKPAE